MKFIHYPITNDFGPTKGGVTIAYNINHTEQGKQLEFSIAQCSTKDVYCKKTGRDVATARFLEGNKLSMTIKGSEKAARKRLYQLKSVAYWLTQLQG